ncbi:efflux RND transporter permease subunit [Sansalvadorimonas verongulae]|uniref:efflux RND transporter permease subunit n=1 Tax=Sansalvadorimonas verongulae TaxID=2172824 RepID=UPI0012BB5704|nr:efflux RND transporter permease subunit [Sansalvadorimonas verongulae]MTI13956.1 efflux RND transporter permease subunit [Sansalvadorimonas verongulae]
MNDIHSSPPEPASTTPQKGIIAWFTSNSVAANLLMVLIICAGLASAFTIKKRMFPDFAINSVVISIPYPGAAPSDIEQSVLLKVEEALRNVRGIDEVISRAWDGMGSVTVKMESGYDIDELYDDVKVKVEGITNLPENAEEPSIARPASRQQVLFISLYGNTDPVSLQRAAQSLQQELLDLPEVLKTDLIGDSPLEISILVPEHNLRKYGLTFDEVATALRSSSIDVAAGALKTKDGDISVTTRGQAYKGIDFANFVIRTHQDGSHLLLSDIATISDGFSEQNQLIRFNGAPSISIKIVSETEQNDIQTSKAVREYLDKRQDSLPQGIQAKAWADASYYLQDRMDMMMENMLYGALLVFLLLSLFLRIRVAMWVMVGIPVSFLGALWVMPNSFMPVSINMLSLFAFIMVLGIVVDDAIIIGESVYTRISKYGHTTDNVVAGVKRVVVPATFGVLTTMAAFLPLLMVEGQVKPFFNAISLVVIFCLFFSLVESKLILPAHLAHMKTLNHQPETSGWLTRIQDKVASGLEQFVRKIYRPLIGAALNNRYITLSAFLGLMIVFIGVLQSPLIRFSFFPDVPSDYTEVHLDMEAGSSLAARNNALIQVEQSLFRLDKRHRESHPDSPGLYESVMVWSESDTEGELFVELIKGEQGAVNAEQLSNLWREEAGTIPGVQELSFSSGDDAGGSKPVFFRLTGNNPKELNMAASELEQHLLSYEGLFDIYNSAEIPVNELLIDILPGAQALGLNLAQLGNQIRQGFYGEEVQRIQRGQEEVRVMLRYPKEERNDLSDLQRVRIRTTDGHEVPFYQVASVARGEGASYIRRTDGKRSLTVNADLNKDELEASTVIEDVQKEFKPVLAAKYPSVSFAIAGASEAEQDSMTQLTSLGVIALILIYGLIAIPLKSYLQPLVIMSIIPFGLVGAMIGHLLLGLQLTMMSIFGLIALAGVLVNDSLILMDFINQGRKQGMSAMDAAMQAGQERFRAIILTSLTTFLGLVPITLESSLQAHFVIPMAVSLGFGILFATFITLILTPALYLVGRDIKRLIGWIWTGKINPHFH